MCSAVLNTIPTDCSVLDKVLGGGIPSEKVSLIYGEPETGKTTLAIQCAVNCARCGRKTLFIDCDKTFYAKRLSQLALGKPARIAELIVLMKPDDFREQAMIIDRLADYVTGNFGLIVIDTINSLYRLRVSESPEKAFELNRELNRQLASLAQVARTRKIAILLVSQVRTAFKQKSVCVEPVATRVLEFWADLVVNMKPTENSSVIELILEKPLTGNEPMTCYLRIEESGIREYLVH